MTKREFDLLSLGEIMLRLSPPDNERITRGDNFSKQAGGAELNSATGVAMLGLRCGIISKLPANDLGMYIKNRVRLCGVSDDYLVYDDDRDARFIIMKMVLIRESPVSCMTERIPLSTKFLWMTMTAVFLRQPAVSIPVELHWH